MGEGAVAGEITCVPDEDLTKRMLHLGVLTLGVYALVMWWFVYRRLPLTLDEDGITLRDERRFSWTDMKSFVLGDDLAINFGDTTISILPSDLENGDEVLRFAKRQVEMARNARRKPASRAPKAQADDVSQAKPKARGGEVGGKVGPNLHFLTTFEGGTTRAQLGERLGRDQGLKYDEAANTLHQDTKLVPPFERVKYIFEGDALKKIQLELALRGDWVDFEVLCRDALFSLEGIGQLVELDETPFDLDRTQDRLESAENRAAAIMFAGEHPKGELTGVMRARAQGAKQLFLLTMTWEPKAE